VKKTIRLKLTFVLLLLLSTMPGLMLANVATANMLGLDLQYLPELAVKSDGGIVVPEGLRKEESPAPEVLTRNGSIYTLTSDIEGYVVVIECSNIVLDGAGYTIHASPAFWFSGLRLLDCNNVTVKNLEVIGDTWVSIFLTGSNCLITNVKTDALRIDSEGFNTVTESIIANLNLWGGTNLVSRCNVSDIVVTEWSSPNTFTKNNFFFNSTVESMFIFNGWDNTYKRTANFWDNGSVGNYWSDYLLKYPNASEVGNTGIGNTPHIIDQDNIDHYPLMYPYDIEKDQIALSTTADIEGQTTQPEHGDVNQPTALVAAISAATITIAVAGLIYQKKRKH
jgi:hypothetical protein